MEGASLRGRGGGWRGTVARERQIRIDGSPVESFGASWELACRATGVTRSPATMNDTCEQDCGTVVVSSDKGQEGADMCHPPAGKVAASGVTHMCVIHDSGRVSIAGTTPSSRCERPSSNRWAEWKRRSSCASWKTGLT